ncbi:MAG: hypothetical protein IKW23_06475, partial [Kiritimatiellae bacterium]|nr:hypothetical protein [Kiritimatiellia bacterium]
MKVAHSQRLNHRRLKDAPRALRAMNGRAAFATLLTLTFASLTDSTTYLCGFTLCTAPMEMIPKNGKKRKFHDLEKREMKANLGDFGVKKQAVLRANSTYFALQCNL